MEGKNNCREWSKESTINKRKMILEEIHLEEIRRITTAVGQRKQGTWTKCGSAKDRAVRWGDLKNMEPKKLGFLIKAVYKVLPTAVNLHAWELTTFNRCRTCGKTAHLKHILTGCEYALRSYTWRHNERLKIFAEASKICCKTANKALNNIYIYIYIYILLRCHVPSRLAECRSFLPSPSVNAEHRRWLWFADTI